VNDGNFRESKVLAFPSINKASSLVKNIPTKRGIQYEFEFAYFIQDKDIYELFESVQLRSDI